MCNIKRGGTIPRASPLWHTKTVALPSRSRTRPNAARRMQRPSVGAPVHAALGNLSFVICHLSFCSGLAPTISALLTLYYAVIPNLVFHSVNLYPDPLAASCKLVASVSLSRS
jgi:hypothetical protein